MAYLQSISGSDYGKQYPLESGTVVLGRHPNCDVVLEASAVSRYHAHLLIKEDGVYVEDLKSRNGTFVNDQPISGQHRLSDTDQIRICDLLFAFRDGSNTNGDPLGTVPGVRLVEDETHSQSSIMGKLDLSADGGRVHVSASADVKLQALLELTNSLAETLEVAEVLPPVLDSLFKIFLQADRGFIMLTDESDKLQVCESKFRRPQDDTVRISRTIMQMVMDEKQAIISADAAEDSRFGLTESIAQFQIRSFMAAPLINRDGDVLGTLQLDTLDPMREFKEQDLEILAAVTSQAAISIQSARMHEAALEQRAMQRDLELAQQVQMALLPQARPNIPAYEFFDFYRAANKIGGDYFDYVHLPDGRLAVIVADVTGHGAASALLMTKLAAEARYCLATVDRPADVVTQLNQ
ncbi:MAG: FHA domain-containing protein, partial [Planctomycetota bacterium]